MSTQSSIHSSTEVASDEHEPWLQLLPWYVNDTLDGHERTDLEEHLDSCLVCRRELDALRGLRDAVRGADDPALAPARGFEKLVQRIDAGHAPQDLDTATTPSLAASLRSAIRRAFAGLPPAVRWTLVGQTALVLVLAGALLVTTQRTADDDAAGFRTLSDGATYLPGDRAVLTVIFAPAASAIERQQAVDSIGATVVAGPDDAGAVTVAISAPPQYATPMSEAAVDALRAHPAVVAAETLGIDRALTTSHPER